MHRVAEVREPLGTLDHAVEQVAVYDPELATVRRLVNPFVRHFDATEVVLHVFARELVVVAGDEDHARAFARLAQQFLHHVVVCLRPVPGAPQLPAVDDVADEVWRLALDVLEKREQFAGLATGRAQVQVRDPDRAHAQAGCRFVVVTPRRGERQCHGGNEVALHDMRSWRLPVTTACRRHDVPMTCLNEKRESCHETGQAAGLDRGLPWWVVQAVSHSSHHN